MVTITKDKATKGEESNYDSLPTFEEAIAGPSQLDAPLSLVSERPLEPLGTEPPAFETYNPSYFTTSNGDVISHDPHLNEDGEALYRFLLSQSDIPPNFQLHCIGTHTEERTKLVSSHDQHHHHGDSNGHNHNHGHGNSSIHTDTETVNVTDFDFTIDLAYLLSQQSSGQLFTLDDTLPASRGHMYSEVFSSPATAASDSFERFPLVESAEEEMKPAFQSRRRAKRKAWKERERQAKRIRDEGLVPWRSHDRDDVAQPMRSSLSVRSWADDYCSSNKRLKEFQFKKVVYGWNFTALRAELEVLIRSAYPPRQFSQSPPSITISFITKPSRISILPDTRLARILSAHTFVKFLLWITLVYPLLWLWRRFHPRGGGVWDICGAAWQLEGSRPSTHRQAESSSVWPRSDLGTAEHEWLREWESTIVHSVRQRTIAREPLRRFGHVERPDYRYSPAEGVIFI